MIDPAQQGLLQTILDDPANTTARLIYADWLDEHNDPDYAEFIRTQCNPPHIQPHYRGSNYSYHQHRMIDKRLGWAGCMTRLLRPLGRGLIDQEHYGRYEWNEKTDGTVYMRIVATCFYLRRGFVDEVCCRLVDWFGVRCPLCSGSGERPYYTRDGNLQLGQCNECQGKGHNRPGPTIMAAHPVTKIVCTDVEPIQLACDAGAVFNWMVGKPEPQSPWFVPPAVFALLPLPTVTIGGEQMEASKYAISHERAMAALSEAMIRWAKEYKP